MKALTIWQPWASLIAIGAKEFETRSWSTNYRGTIAIHAAKKDTSEIFMGIEPEIRKATVSALLKAGVIVQRAQFPHLGCIVAVAELIGCHKILAEDDGTPYYRYIPTAQEQEQLKQDFPGQKEYGGPRIRRFPIACQQELLFGDWTPGRYAWELANVTMLTVPTPAFGAQGLWNWEEGTKDV